MTVVWVDSNTEPSVLAHRILCRVWADEEASAEYEAVCERFSTECKGFLDGFVSDARVVWKPRAVNRFVEYWSGPPRKSRWKLPWQDPWPPWLQRVAGLFGIHRYAGFDVHPRWSGEEAGVRRIFEPWCRRWAGRSLLILELAVTEAVIKYLGVSWRKAHQVPGLLDSLTEPFRVLLDPDRRRVNSKVRQAARGLLKDSGFNSRQEVALARGADAYFCIRIKGETVQSYAGRVGSGEDDRDPRNLIRALEPWDEAAGHSRKRGRPRSRGPKNAAVVAGLPESTKQMR